MVQAAGRPRINDIATDLDDVPAFTHAASLPELEGADLGYPEAFKPLVRNGYPDLCPLELARPARQAFEDALRIARGRPGWTVTSVDDAGLTFEAVAVSYLFRFRDDVVVRVRRRGAGSVVDARSRSRDGQGDLGVNADRIRRLLADLARE
jgi:uncharacterized protein (DUF1499 family)